MKRFLLPILTGIAAVAAHAQESDSVRMYRLQQIEVTATRATPRTPVAYTDLSHDAIARNSYGTDIPTVLALTPSMIATNETGIGIGGTSIRLRGTDATRLNVTINGVAMNNPDSHSMYWYDTPDLISAVGTMQVQRGAGLSTNGTGAFGGAVNMTTGALSTEFSGEASLSYGSYNTNKQAIGISSGLLGGHWAVDARLTHIGSDGYIDRGATDLKSYLFQGGYYNGRTMVKLLSFGGKAKTYLTYNGVTMEDMERYGRRYHDSGQYQTSAGPHVLADGSHVGYYDDQTDNYLQINNQLILNHRFNDHWALNATAFYTYGYGYYKQYKDDAELAEYVNLDTEIQEADLIREKIMRNHLGGLNASASYTSRALDLNFGGSWSYYTCPHWGELDEIDAVGRQRGAGLGGGHDEREQTLNQLLVEMDGFESNEGVILIAATNRPDVLDPALLRPGRFDRQVVVPTPDVKGRLKILEVHTRRTPLDKHVNLEVIARGTPGFSGAALENLVNEAALQAARLGQDTVFMRDFEYAKDKVLMGKERRSLILSDEEKRITAYHEGGHALVAKLLPGTDPVHKVTIIPRGRALGVTMQLPEGDRHGYSKAFLQNNLMVLLAGRVAEEIIFDTITTGAGNDIERATGMARKMVCEWGMSDVVGPMTIGEQGEEVFIGRDWGHARNYSEDTARIVDAEIKKLVETARENCHKLLQENINLLHALAKALLDRETITGDDIDLLVKGEPLPPFDADGSAAKQEPAAPAPASADAEGETFKLEAEPSQDGGTGEKTQDETKQQ